MKFTGERPTLESGIEASRIKYKSIIPFCLGKRVLDYGCGIGHGTYYLSKYAKTAIGYDYSKESIQEAKKNFKLDNLKFVDSIKDFEKHLLNDMDILTMIEVIEHIEKDDLDYFLSKTCLKECVCSTPNGDLFPYQPKSKSERQGFHVWHYTEKELFKLFLKHYDYVEIYGIARDSNLQKESHTTYLVYATNEVRFL